MALNEQLLLTADRGHIVGTLGGLANKTPDTWLSAGHPGRDGQLPRSWKSVNLWNDAHKVETVAFSGPTHCIDGWSYASRALAALLAGDTHAARHLAYYAQLRAGLSILASVGVGVFNGINFAVQKDGSVVRIDPTIKASTSGMGTHEVVWEALQAWVTDTKSAEEFLRLLLIRNVSVFDCVDTVWPSFNSQAVADQLINAWGLDLKRGKDEHRYRKISSYVPQAFNPMHWNPGTTSDLISDFWHLFEPSSGPGFDRLDAFLLRSAFRRQNSIVAGKQAMKNGRLPDRYPDLPDSVKSIASLDFFLGLEDPAEPRLIQLARETTNPALPEEMIARSVLLLRAALSLNHSNFAAAGLAGGGVALRPWLDQIAIQRGFFDPNSALQEMSDLWSDVQLALEDMENGMNPPAACLHEWFARRPIGLPTVTEAERVGLWSLCA